MTDHPPRDLDSMPWQKWHELAKRGICSLTPTPRSVRSCGYISDLLPWVSFLRPWATSWPQSTVSSRNSNSFAIVRQISSTLWCVNIKQGAVTSGRCSGSISWTVILSTSTKSSGMRWMLPWKVLVLRWPSQIFFSTKWTARSKQVKFYFASAWLRNKSIVTQLQLEQQLFNLWVFCCLWLHEIHLNHCKFLAATLRIKTSDMLSAMVMIWYDG